MEKRRIDDLKMKFKNWRRNVEESRRNIKEL
jgi:hypothetical protein